MYYNEKKNLGIMEIKARHHKDKQAYPFNK